MPTPTPQQVLPPGVTHSRRAAILMLLGFLGAGIPLPWTAVALIPLALAGVESVRALQAMSRGGAPTRVTVWSGLGLALIVAMALVISVPYLFFGASMGYQHCLEGANTAVASAQCEADFSNGLQGVLGDLLTRQ